jgi:hypothetical protein
VITPFRVVVVVVVVVVVFPGIELGSRVGGACRDHFS